VTDEGSAMRQPNRQMLQPRRLRAAAARAPGGCSSLLRLSAASRLPSGAALGQWIGRAGRALQADTPPAFAN
jgi:hypothetical protein